jgi:hypothetical protein
MYSLFVYDLEGCIYDVEHKDILMLKPSFNIFLVKRLFVALKDQIRLLKNHFMHKSKQ